MSERIQDVALEAQEIRQDRGHEPPSLSDRVRSLRLPDRPGPAPRVAWLPWTLTVVLAAIAGMFAYQAWTRPEPAEVKPADGAPVALSAPTNTTAASGDVALESKGNIVPVHQITVSPKVGGMVEKLYVEEGKRVNKGDVLAEVEKVDYLADRDHAKAVLEEARQNLLELTEHRQKEVDQAKARWEEAAAQSRQLGLDKRRSVRLRSGGALADRDYEQADSAYQAMVEHEKVLRMDHELLEKGPRDNRIEASKRRVAQAQADLTKAEWRLENCTVRAPITGTILTKKAEEGVYLKHEMGVIVSFFKK